MTLKQVHKSLVSGRFTVFVSILIAFVLRVIANPDWLNLFFWGTFLIQIAVALALLQLNHSFTIIREKTMLPAVLFLLLTGTDPLFYNQFSGSIAAFIVLYCFHSLFNSYQEQNSQLGALNCSLALTVGSLFCPSLLLLFPFLWYGAFRFRCLNVRTFFATIIGIILVYMFAFIWSIYRGDVAIFLNLLPQKSDFFTFHTFDLSTREWIIGAFILILVIISSFSVFMKGFTEKIRARSFLFYLYFAGIYIFTLLFFQDRWKEFWLLVLFVPVSMILSYYFTLSTRKISIWLLLLSLCFFIGMYFWQLTG